MRWEKGACLVFPALSTMCSSDDDRPSGGSRTCVSAENATSDARRPVLAGRWPASISPASSAASFIPSVSARIRPSPATE